MQYLYDRLKEYAASGYYGFHMPGHKRNPSVTGAGLPYEIDITEVEGFDDLHHAKGILKEAQERASQVYRAEESHYLVNGSTVGLLSAVLGCTSPGDTILMARNCHKSIYNAVYMNRLRPIYIYPEILSGTGINGVVQTFQVAELLKENPHVKAVIISSTTYDGVVSDVSAIARIAHQYEVPLILDEAHGAHFGFHPYFPENGNVLGADIVIHSLHKTLPSLTQTALLHMNGDIVDRERVRTYLHILQSSSPSYVLMASIDECVRLLMEERESLFDNYVQLLKRTRAVLSNMTHLRLFETGGYDRSKILIDTSRTGIVINGEMKKYTGKQLSEHLREKYLIQVEMASPGYIIAMTSPGDTRQGMERLVSALSEIDGELAEYKNSESYDSYTDLRDENSWINQQVYPIGEINKFTSQTKYVPFGMSEGAVAVEYAYLYPPGIPLVVPGERISKRTAECLESYTQQGFDIEGTQIKGKIEVLGNG